MPKEKPKVNIGEVIRSYRSDRGLSQGDIERRTGLLRCYLSRVENGHTVPSLETLAKIAEAMEISLADFFPGTDTPQDRETRKMLGELSEEEIRFLAEIKRYSTTLSDDDKSLVLAMIRKMATIVPPQRATKSSASHATAPNQACGQTCQRPAQILRVGGSTPSRSSSLPVGVHLYFLSLVRSVFIAGSSRLCALASHSTHPLQCPQCHGNGTRRSA